MISFKFQIQQKCRTGYKPFYLGQSPYPLEFDDLMIASEMYKTIVSRFTKSTFRLVKIETYLIECYEP